MTLLLSAVAFLVLLSLLIMIHEFGHFSAARRAGVIVEEFGFGLPPRAKTLFTQGGTRFTLNWIPFGGFVRLKGENAMNEKERKAKGSFGAASYLDRITILVAGVFMNFVLAIVLLTVGFSMGRWIPTYLTLEDMQAADAAGVIHLDMAVLIDEVQPEGAAAAAGVPAKSLLIAIDGVALTDPAHVVTLQEGKDRVTYTLMTGEKFAEEQMIEVQPRDGKTGVVVGAFARELSAPLRNVWDAFLLSLRESRVMMVQTVIGIGTLFTSLVSSGRVPDGITGIVGIAQLTHASVQAGFMTYLRLVALLSLSLAVLNILPFPALDGGRLLFVLTEMITNRPLNRRFEMATNAIGFSVLLLLIVLITFHDIISLF